jgi:predicted deacylase
MTEIVYPIELSAPDISPYKTGNTGIDYISSFDSGKSGPHVMLTAVVHGNELCGAIALDFLLQHRIRPIHGKLTLGFMNVAAFHNFSPKSPGASRFVDEDFNRLWAESVLDGTRDSSELRRAREVRPLIDQVDFLLDIHSMQHTTEPLMMCGPLPKGMQLARAIGFPRYIVSDAGHQAGKRMRDYTGFGNPEKYKNALLVECGQHWCKASATVAKETALRFLKHFAMIDSDFIAEHLPAEPPPPTMLIQVTEAVTITGEEFKFADNYVGMEVIEQAGSIIGWDGTREVLTPYDNCVLIMPSKRLYRGQTAVRLGKPVDY